MEAYVFFTAGRHNVESDSQKITNRKSKLKYKKRANNVVVCVLQQTTLKQLNISDNAIKIVQDSSQKKSKLKYKKGAYNVVVYVLKHATQ